MSRAIAIGDELLLAGYALAGVEVVDSPDPERARAAWRSLAADVSLVILTADAHGALCRELGREDEVVWAVIPT
jgi:vacuolar-type H+-ATPase subunit F/Vma7